MVLISLDGWGLGAKGPRNAIDNCDPRNMTWLAARYSSARLDASGLAVGLPAGQMGNSEVGHTCLGAGRIVLQDLLRITRAFETGEARDNRVLAQVMDQAAGSGRALHLMGLISDGGVHSHIAHAKGLVAMAKERGVRKILVHAFLDGRDTPPRSATRYIADLETFFSSQAAGSFATIMGRYYAMDRDNRWERTEAAYRGMTEGAVGATYRSGSAAEALAAAYDRGEDDEFVKPTVIAGDGDPAGATVRDGDAVIFFNFRADRARQITRGFTQPDFTKFTFGARPVPAAFVCLTRYDETFNLPVAFPPSVPERVLGEVIADAGLRQLRIAETEKYAHVTFFFNGGREEPFEREERILIPSPKVATYDLEPEMSAGRITEALLARLAGAPRDLVVILNFANADMVGHTGRYEATVRACKFVDECVGRIAKHVLGVSGSLIVTADHGNAEQMADPVTGGPHTAHTLNPVPVIVATDAPASSGTRRLRPSGSLADVAPTMLALLGLPQPSEMTGRSLLV